MYLYYNYKRSAQLDTANTNEITWLTDWLTDDRRYVFVSRFEFQLRNDESVCIFGVRSLSSRVSTHDIRVVVNGKLKSGAMSECSVEYCYYLEILFVFFSLSCILFFCVFCFLENQIVSTRHRVIRTVCLRLTMICCSYKTQAKVEQLEFSRDSI